MQFHRQQFISLGARQGNREMRGRCGSRHDAGFCAAKWNCDIAQYKLIEKHEDNERLRASGPSVRNQEPANSEL